MGDLLLEVDLEAVIGRVTFGVLEGANTHVGIYAWEGSDGSPISGCRVAAVEGSAGVEAVAGVVGDAGAVSNGAVDIVAVEAGVCGIDRGLCGCRVEVT